MPQWSHAYVYINVFNPNFKHNIVTMQYADWSIIDNPYHPSITIQPILKIDNLIYKSIG